MCKRWIYPILLYCWVVYVSRCISICFCIFPTVLYSTLFGVLYLYHRCVFPIVLFGAHLSLRSWIKYCGVLLFLLVCLPSVVCVFVLFLVCILLMHFSTFCTFTFSTFNYRHICLACACSYLREFWALSYRLAYSVTLLLCIWSVLLGTVKPLNSDTIASQKKCPL